MITREQIEKEFHIEQGIITTLGKFQCEPVYVPYFWELFLNGCYDFEDGDEIVYNIEDADLLQFPELKEAKEVRIWVDNEGAVNSKVVKKDGTIKYFYC